MGRFGPRCCRGVVAASVCAAACIATACDGPESIRQIEDRRDAASPRLIELLGTSSPERRVRAAVAMGRIQSPDYAMALARASREGSPALREVALFALGQLGLAQDGRIPEAAVLACLAAVEDPDPEIVAAAIEALGKLADSRVPGTLIPFLGHDSTAVRIAAAQALFRCRFAPLWRGDTEAPPELPDRAVAALLAAAEDPEPEVRRAVAYAFSRYGQTGAAPTLIGLVDEQDELTRLFAVRAIGNSGDPRVAGTLSRALGDPVAGVRVEALSALAKLDQPVSGRDSLADDPSFHVRAGLAAALAGGNTTASIGTLRQLERDASTTVRAAAISALAQRLRDDYVEALVEHLGDEAWQIRAAAARAAGHLEASSDLLLERAMRDADHRVRTAGLEALSVRGNGASMIIDALDSPDLAVRGTAVSLLAERDDPQKLKRLSEALELSAGIEWIEIREGICDALAEIDGAVSLLRRISREDPAASVRSKARVALAARGEEVSDAIAPPPDPSPFLETQFENDPEVVLETTRGEIVIRCFSRAAPIHVASFVDLVGQGFYDGLIWHRVVSNFVIQGGDPRGDGWGSAGHVLRDEINRRRFGRGAVGMPKAGKDTGGCQLFITHIPTPHLDGNYTIFGQVVSGIDVVDRIEVGDAILRASVR